MAAIIGRFLDSTLTFPRGIRTVATTRIGVKFVDDLAEPAISSFRTPSSSPSFNVSGSASFTPSGSPSTRNSTSSRHPISLHRATQRSAVPPALIAIVWARVSTSTGARTITTGSIDWGLPPVIAHEIETG